MTPTALSAPARPHPAPLLVVAAFAAVYVLWGSTYYGIRVAVETMPPFLMAGTRFFLAGACLYAWSRYRGAGAPQPVHWRSAAVIGSLFLLMGNGALSWAEQSVPSGLCALMIAATPLWMNLVEWLRPGGRTPAARVFFGLALGFAGVALIVSAHDAGGHRAIAPAGAVVLLIAPLSWALGSIYSRHAPQSPFSLLNIGMQMLCGGALMWVTGLVLGEGSALRLASISTASWCAFAYLSIAGSLVGFTAYVWLLQVSTPARVSTYAYVNPLIAVLLGRWLLHEPLSPTVALAGALILGAVLALTLVPKPR